MSDNIGEGLEQGLGEVWNIRIHGYGTFQFTGTEAEAEEMRLHKSRWEQAKAHKWRASLTTEADRLTAQIAKKLDAGGGVPLALVRKLARARKVDAQPSSDTHP